MAFEKGNNLGGRTKGSTNKNTTEIRERFRLLLEANLDSIQEDLDSLDPEERLKVLLHLSKFVLPTLKNTELTSGEDQPPITIKFID